MTFTSAVEKIPTSIGKLVIILVDPDGIAKNMYTRYQLVVLDQTGRIFNIPQDTGDLEPHLTEQQKQTLVDFMLTMRKKAYLEILMKEVAEAGSIESVEVFGLPTVTVST